MERQPVNYCLAPEATQQQQHAHITPAQAAIEVTAWCVAVLVIGGLLYIPQHWDTVWAFLVAGF